MSFRSRILLSLGLCISCYMQILNAPLLWDDDNFIRFNRGIQTLRSLPHYVLHPEDTSKMELYNISIYRPLRTFFYSLQYALFGTSGLGYHLFSLLLHLINGVLVFLILRKFGSKALAWTFSTIWLLHPLQTEAVSFVSSQGDLLVALFFLLSTLHLWKSVRQKKEQIEFAGVYFLLLCLTLLSKEIAVMTVPIQLALLILLPKNFENRKVKIWIIGIGGSILTLGYLFLRFALLKKMTQVDHATEAFWHHLFISAPKTYLSYLGILFFPFRQNALYASIRWTGVEFIPPLLLIAFFYFRRFRPVKQFYVGLLWFILLLLPVSNVIPISISFAERFTYLSSVGVYIALIPVTELILKRRSPSYLILIILLFSALTFQRNKVWADEVKLFEDIARKSPNFHTAHFNLLAAYYERGKYPESYREIQLIDSKPWGKPKEYYVTKRETACRLAKWEECIAASTLFLQDQKEADASALWIIRSERGLGRLKRSKDLLKQYCKRNSKTDDCLK